MSLLSKSARLSEIIRGWSKMTGLTLMSPFDEPSRTLTLRAAHVLDVYQRTPKLPKVTATHLVSPEVALEVTYFTTDNWQVSTTELCVLAALAAHHQPKQIFEFGTFDGRTTLNLHRNCPAAMIHTLDLPPTQQNLPDHKSAGELLQKHDTLGRVHQLYGNSLDFDFSDFVGKQDFVFIDAGHSYRNAISDSKNALRMLEGREGVIVWHDYGTWPGVTKAVEEIKSMIQSATFYWVQNTSLAVMTTAAGRPLDLSGDMAFKT